MKRLLIAIVISLISIIPVLAQPRDGEVYPTVPPKYRFVPLAVYVDSGEQALAAYQFELTAAGAEVKIVGVESGEHKAFGAAPYYDPAAMMNNRIIIAAFNTGDDLPTGRTRVARLHLQIKGDAQPEYEIKLITAGDNQGDKINAQISLAQGE